MIPVLIRFDSSFQPVSGLSNSFHDGADDTDDAEVEVSPNINRIPRCVPTDRKRLNVQHQAFHYIQGNKNYLAPMDTVLKAVNGETKRAIDIGCGEFMPIPCHTQAEHTQDLASGERHCKGYGSALRSSGHSRWPKSSHMSSSSSVTAFLPV